MCSILEKTCDLTKIIGPDQARDQVIGANVKVQPNKPAEAGSGVDSDSYVFDSYSDRLRTRLGRGGVVQPVPGHGTAQSRPDPYLQALRRKWASLPNLSPKETKPQPVADVAGERRIDALIALIHEGHKEKDEGVARSPNEKAEVRQALEEARQAQVCSGVASAHQMIDRLKKVPRDQGRLLQRQIRDGYRDLLLSQGKSPEKAQREAEQILKDPKGKIRSKTGIDGFIGQITRQALIKVVVLNAGKLPENIGHTLQGLLDVPVVDIEVPLKQQIHNKSSDDVADSTTLVPGVGVPKLLELNINELVF